MSFIKFFLATCDGTFQYGTAQRPPHVIRRTDMMCTLLGAVFQRFQAGDRRLVHTRRLENRQAHKRVPHVHAR